MQEDGDDFRTNGSHIPLFCLRLAIVNAVFLAHTYTHGRTHSHTLFGQHPRAEHKFFEYSQQKSAFWHGNMAAWRTQKSHEPIGRHFRHQHTFMAAISRYRYRYICNIENLKCSACKKSANYYLFNYLTDLSTTWSSENVLIKIKLIL